MLIVLWVKMISVLILYYYLVNYFDFNKVNEGYSMNNIAKYQMSRNKLGSYTCTE